MPANGPADDTGALESLRRKLYATNAPDAFPAPALAHAPAPAPVSAWQAPEAPTKKRPPLSVLFLIAAGGFFAIALAAAAYFLVFGTRAISTDHITIAVDPIASIGSGDTATLLIRVKNQNPTAITNTRLSIDFPDSARSPGDARAPMPRFEDTIGDIPAGETRERSVSVALFGGIGETITLPLKLEYRTEGSNAVFVKDASFTTTISSSPVTVSVLGPAQASANQPLTLTVSVRSNAKTALSDVVVRGEYPFGFIPAKAASSTGALVALGTLAPGEEKSFTLAGTLSGEASEERVFRFSAGTEDKAAPGTLALTYASGQAVVGVAKPFLSTRLAIDGDTASVPVIAGGRAVQGTVSWQNTIAAPILDGEIAVKLSGDALDTGSITASGGFYRSGDTTVLFNRDTNPGLASLDPSETGTGTFIFHTKTGAALLALRNPTITATVSVSGRKAGALGAQALASTITRTIQVGTDLGFATRATRSSGPFTNTGPIPPAPDTESTYTVLLSFTNTVNNVAGATVSATLPSYVRYTGAVSPADGSILYNPATHTVTWNAGDVPAGTSASAPKQAAFQVAFLPSTSQRGTSPILMNAASYSGTDRFTKKVLSGTAPAVTIQITGDTGYQSAWGEVQH